MIGRFLFALLQIHYRYFEPEDYKLMDYETVIGLEVHVELLTKTKLFCSCPNRFNAPPNSLVCPVCLGLPGVLPVINEEALNKHIQTALSLDCRILQYSKFDRKNYFYPDMPKNFQISQYDLPVAEGGCLEISIDGVKKKIGVTRIHLEEDTGKSIHAGESKSIASADYTLLNYNRAGVPLLEIVSEPDMRTPEEAYKYLVQMKKILTWLQVSDCKMEEGSLRCDANISIREKGCPTFGTKTEIKNMNSFKSVRAALEYERKRQIELIEKGEKIIQETRGWEEDQGITISMRSKEEAHDYRYFPEPDLPPIRIGDDWIDRIRQTLPVMPEKLAEKLVSEYSIPSYDAEILTSYREFADFFLATASYHKDADDYKQISNWMMGDISKYLNVKELQIQESKLTPESLAKMIEMIKDEIISGKIGKKLIEELLEKGGDPEKITKERNWTQITAEDELLPLIKETIEKNQDALELYLSGKESTREFFIGQVMKMTKGKASPKALGNLVDMELKKIKEGM
jgi:aspartyl-tRNA(Asn)/glutamyl-tRNA(Gln) amidotransferase subunit B